MAAINQKGSGNTLNLSLRNNPLSPAREFTKMNGADSAAVSLMVDQRPSNNTGDNSIPPPMPTMPG